MTSFLTFRFCLAALVIFSSIAEISAQTIPISPKAIRDSRGKDFWLGFPRNHHQTLGDLDKLYISVVAERATRGNIQYRRNGRIVNQPFVLDVNGIYTLELDFFEMEIDNPLVQRRSFHITSNEEVSVYGLSVANTTSDAFLAFPTDVLGREYIITSYPSNIAFQGNGVNAQTSTMSQFAMVAAFDSTVVQIIPTARVWGARTIEPFTITLNQGETYLVSNYLARENLEIDYTGSRVIASKPLVVYGGHERAAIPIAQGQSRDCLIEQMLPVESWGKTALVAPYPIPLSGRPAFGTDLVRVVAGYDSTVVRVNGSTVATLRAGAFYEMVISTASSIVTSQPAIVAGYKSSGANTLGDPFLAIIPPVEQFLTRYRFICVQGQQITQNNRVEAAFSEHYVTIIVPTTKATTVVLDGTPLRMSNFSPIGQTDYSYALLSVGQGTHNVTADTTFGITVSGYGRANSYGYIGGQRFETDIRPPTIVTRRTCTGIDGAAFDSALTDAKLFFFDTLDNTQKNIRFRLGALPRPADSLTFQADLQNPYEDGALGIVVVDSLDLRTVQRVVVPGFTVHLNPTIRTNAVVSTSSILRVATGRDYCFRLRVSNYGATHQTVQQVGFARGGLNVFSSASRPTRIEPSSQGTIEYCFRTDQDGTFVDTLTISNGCISRPVLAIRIEAAQDRLAPTLTRTADSCNRIIILETSDNRTFDAGLERIDVALQNMSSRREFIPFSTTASQTLMQPPLDSTKRAIRLMLNVTNPRLDAVYAVTVRDSVGNLTTVRDTIPGFTVQFAPASDTLSGKLQRLVQPLTPTVNTLYEFSPVNALAITCGTIVLRNTGIVPFVLEEAFMQQNLRFSLPPSQFPVVIPPQSARLLTVCFNPLVVAAYTDTIAVSKFCITERIALTGAGLLGTRLVGTRCEAVIQFTPILAPSANQPFVNALSSAQSSAKSASNLSSDAQLPFSVQHFPDPATDYLTLRIGVQSAETLSVRILSMTGAEVASLPKQVLERGSWDMTMRLENIESGTYLCEVRSEGSTGGRWTGLVRVVR